MDTTPGGFRWAPAPVLAPWSSDRHREVVPSIRQRRPATEQGQLTQQGPGIAAATSQATFASSRSYDWRPSRTRQCEEYISFRPFHRCCNKCIQSIDVVAKTRFLHRYKYSVRNSTELVYGFIWNGHKMQPSVSWLVHRKLLGMTSLTVSSMEVSSNECDIDRRTEIFIFTVLWQADSINIPTVNVVFRPRWALKMCANCDNDRQPGMAIQPPNPK